MPRNQDPIKHAPTPDERRVEGSKKMTEKLWYTGKQAAGIMGLDPRALARMRKDGKGPVYRQISERVVHYRLEDIKNWLDEIKKNHTPEGETDND